MKILIVEDEAPIRLLLAKTVQSMGHEAEIAEDGVTGLAKFKTFEPDIVLTDILMPKMDGLELLEHIRKISSDAVVIIVSAHGSAEYTLKALQLKANDYIMKPFRPRQLKDYLDKYEPILKSRTIDQEILGMFMKREFILQFSNDLELVAKLADKLMQETYNTIPKNCRLGVHLGFAEVLLNAIEHGNLGITFEEKKNALEKEGDEWKKLLAERLSDPKLKSRHTRIHFLMSPEACEWTITDEGNGFDWHNMPDQSDPEVLLAANGRGILLARMQFDELEYNEKGNQVRIKKYLR